jgi:hypothetical protein
MIHNIVTCSASQCLKAVLTLLKHTIQLPNSFNPGRIHKMSYESGDNTVSLSGCLQGRLELLSIPVIHDGIA